MAGPARRRVPPVPPRKPKGKPQPAVPYKDISALTGVKIGAGGIKPADKITTEIAKKPVLNAQARERQRLLKAQGYNIVVDGIWGARSQEAWNAYKRQVRAEQKRAAA